MLLSIGESIIEFGKQYGFNIWDWSAVLISFCSVLIAFISLIVATKTLRSQRKTERNTLPSINENVQISLLAQSLRDVFDAYTLIFSLDYLLAQSNYRIVPSYHFWQLVKLNPSDIHESLFYSSQLKLTPIHQLKSAFFDFNNSLSSLREQLNSDDSESKKLEINHLYDEVGYFLSVFSKLLRNSFNFSESEIADFFNGNFFNRRHGKFTLRFMAKYCPRENSDNLILPLIDNSLAFQYLKNKYAAFYDIANIRGFNNTSKDLFIKHLSREVDLILLNTIQDGVPVKIYDDSTNVNNRSKFLIFDRDSYIPFSGDSMGDYIEPLSTVETRNSWIFFVRNL